MTNIRACRIGTWWVATTDLQSAKTVARLRGLDIETLNNASVAVTTAQGDISHNIGCPPGAVDEMAAPSTLALIREGHFANVAVLSGWTQDDVSISTDPTIATAEETHNFLQVGSFLPDLSSATVVF
ncbi:hypothetical protein GGX14DRAFT_561858 [Mycena pura]|uniref:Uncharacterized protein n=1 Tax=Mycena pura TaxID=153505 RepID=A0AAD6VMN6_9AGAR|nr:hypothetical protein GGX14DRAFT_561858 [Mycena pura]